MKEQGQKQLTVGEFIEILKAYEPSTPLWMAIDAGIGEVHGIEWNPSPDNPQADLVIYSYDY